jgi:DnaJ-class molecular chaperone
MTNEFIGNVIDPKIVMCPYCQGLGAVKEILPLWKRPFRMAMYIPCIHCHGTGRIE